MNYRTKMKYRTISKLLSGKKGSSGGLKEKTPERNDGKKSVKCEERCGAKGRG